MDVTLDCGMELDAFYKYEYDIFVTGSLCPSWGYFQLPALKQIIRFDVTFIIIRTESEVSAIAKLIWSYVYGRWLK